MIHKTVREIAGEAVHDGCVCINFGEPRSSVFWG